MKSLPKFAIIKINVKQRQTYAMENGKELYIQDGFNFNLREDRGTRGYCVSCEGIPEGVEVLVNYLAMEASYDMPYQREFLTEEEIKEGYQLRHIPQDMIFCYLKNDEWEPFGPVLITKRIFKPYDGPLVGIEPEKIKNRLYIVKGKDTWDGEEKDLSGLVCAVTLNSDYQVHFHDANNRPQSLIRTLHRELEAIDYSLTKEVEKGKYLVGNDIKDAKQLNELNHDSKAIKKANQAS